MSALAGARCPKGKITDRNVLFAPKQDVKTLGLDALMFFEYLPSQRKSGIDTYPSLAQGEIAEHLSDARRWW